MRCLIVKATCFRDSSNHISGKLTVLFRWNGSAPAPGAGGGFELGLGFEVVSGECDIYLG